jgi:hypothetical protein
VPLEVRLYQPTLLLQHPHPHQRLHQLLRQHLRPRRLLRQL